MAQSPCVIHQIQKHEVNSLSDWTVSSLCRWCELKLRQVMIVPLAILHPNSVRVILVDQLVILALTSYGLWVLRSSLNESSREETWAFKLPRLHQLGRVCLFIEVASCMLYDTL